MVESIDSRTAEFEASRQALRVLGAIIEPIAPTKRRILNPTSGFRDTSGKVLICRVIANLDVREPWVTTELQNVPKDICQPLYNNSKSVDSIE